MSPPITPNFFLVGAFKAGTTALYRFLGQHPDVYLSPRKEPAFFVPEFRVERLNPEWRRLTEKDAPALSAYLDDPYEGAKQPLGPVTRWEDYLKLFRLATPGQAVGEASVGCLWSRTAARLIAERIPHARILMVLRNPCDRAFSQYLALSPRNARLSFSEAIRQSSRTAPGGPLDSLNPFLEFGLYSDQVTRFLNVFPADRVGVYLYDDFVNDPETLVRDAFRLLDLRTDVPLDLSERHNEPRIPRFPRLERTLNPLGRRLRAVVPVPVRRYLRAVRFRPRWTVRMDPEDRRFLIDYYADDVRELSALIGRDLSKWLTD